MRRIFKQLLCAFSLAALIPFASADEADPFSDQHSLRRARDSDSASEINLFFFTSRRSVKAFVDAVGYQSSVGDAHLAINNQFKVHTDPSMFVSQAVSMIDSITFYMSIEELYERLPKAVLLAILGLTSERIPLETLDAGKYKRDYDRILKVIGRTESDIIERVVACTDRLEYELLYRLLFFQYRPSDHYHFTEVAKSDRLASIDAKTLVHDYSPHQVYFLALIMPLDRLMSIIGDLLGLTDHSVYQNYHDEILALTDAAKYNSEFVLSVPAGHLGSPSVAAGRSRLSSVLDFGAIFLATYIGVYSTSESINTPALMAISGTVAATAAYMRRQLDYARLQLNRYREAITTKFIGAALRQRVQQCEKEFDPEPE